MLDTQTVRNLAARLHDAERSRQQIGQISLEHPDITIADAYAIQRAWMDIKLAEGRVKRGHKIGLTSRAMQQASQINEPDFGMLLDDMFFCRWQRHPRKPFHPAAPGSRAGVRAGQTAARPERDVVPGV